MATRGEEQVGYSLAKVGNVILENHTEIPDYISIVICQNKIILVDYMMNKVMIYRLQDGKFIYMLDKLDKSDKSDSNDNLDKSDKSDKVDSNDSESRPRDICPMDATTICILHFDGLIKMASINSEDMSPVFKITESFRLNGVFDLYYSVVRVNDNIVVTGAKQDTTYWCIASLNDGHVETIHQICKGSGWSYVTTKDNIIYISCVADLRYLDDSGVYGFDILNPSQCKYKYKHIRLQSPRSIVINGDGYIFVCNNGVLDDPCIHQLTSSCQPVAIFSLKIKELLQAMFWDNGRLYVTGNRSRDITVFHNEYQGSHKESEVQVSDKRKVPGVDESAIQISQRNADIGQSSVETETPPSGLGPDDTENEKQDKNDDTKSPNV